MINFKPYEHHAVELERAILGICLLEKTAFSRTVGLVKAECFYDIGHKKVYEVVEDMYTRSIPIDLFTVTHELIEKGVKFISNIDTPAYLASLTTMVVSSAHIEFHCAIVKERWRRRRIIEIKYAGLEDSDSHLNIEKMNAELLALNEQSSGEDWVSMDELVFRLMVHQIKFVTGEQKFTTTGLKKLDSINNGFSGGDLVILAARPAVGKSAFMGMMAIEQAKEGHRVGVVSLEMSNNQIAARLASLDTGIDFKTIYTDIANDEALHKRFYEKVKISLTKLPIYVSDKTKASVMEIRAKAQKLKYKHGINVLFVDYLQLIDSATGNRNYNREQEVAQMSRGLKILAKDLDIPVIALCQLNRESEKRAGKNRYPRLSDLRESGAIEQDADVVMFLHRDFVSGITENQETGESTERDANLIVAKWRNGEPLMLNLEFDPQRMKFSEQVEATKWKQVNELTANPF